MIEYNWNCRTVDVKPTEGDLTDVVYNIHWILIASKDAISKTSIGTVTVTLNEDEATSFISFNDLTNDMVSGWVQAAMGEDKLAALKTSLATAIEEEAHPTSVTMYIEN
jgi:hypothetical protein